jgi:hypothetical protein
MTKVRGPTAKAGHDGRAFFSILLYFGFFYFLFFIIKGNFVFLLVLQGYNKHFTCLLSDLMLKPNSRGIDITNF